MIRALALTAAILALIFQPFALSGTVKSLPASANLDVPFLCQAPFGSWEQPWQDACEEAAVIMAIHYAWGHPLDKTIGRDEILRLVKFQDKTYGGHHDLNAKRTAVLFTDFYGYKKFTVKYDITVQGIKTELASGNLVLTPMAGRLLGNRYYSRPGPVYHYMVFKGYDDARGEFITNDPGTKRGQGYRYKYATAYNAIHDWAGSKDNIASGRKVMIVVYK